MAGNTAQRKRNRSVLAEGASGAEQEGDERQVKQVAQKDLDPPAAKMRKRVTFEPNQPAEEEEGKKENNTKNDPIEVAKSYLRRHMELWDKSDGFPVFFFVEMAPSGWGLSPGAVCRLRTCCRKIKASTCREKGTYRVAVRPGHDQGWPGTTHAMSKW